MANGDSFISVSDETWNSNTKSRVVSFAYPRDAFQTSKTGISKVAGRPLNPILESLKSNSTVPGDC